ncbi:MAG: phytoene desaturase family protein [Myxococcota bacterium]
MADDPILVVGAGIAGLVAAIDLARTGREVVVLERADAPGGKLRPFRVADRWLDGGPTVLTLRRVFDGLFADASACFEERVGLRPAEILARHAWPDDTRFDLHADPERSAEEIGRVFGATDAAAFLAFTRETRALFDTLDASFLQVPSPSVFGLIRTHFPSRLGALLAIRPFVSLATDLARRFRDPRLRQLFGRYATYVGSSPFDAPATLALIAHVEQAGVWLVEGGLAALADALVRLAVERGVRLRVGAEVVRIAGSGRGIEGVVLADGERVEGRRVLFAGDATALAEGLLDEGIGRAARIPRTRERSLSAMTWTIFATTRGFPLVRHNVFFSGDARAEFDALVQRRVLPADPTVYVCAQDRDARSGATYAGPERLLCLVNAPATGDRDAWQGEEVERCEARVFEGLAKRGLRIERDPANGLRTTPADWHRRYPGTGGALYGQATHGWRSSFSRPGPRTKLPGLYLAGGSVHPGAGVPMAAMSGRQAARAILEDSASTSRSRSTATAGGTSTPSIRERATP